jgi:hypothetical protein
MSSDVVLRILSFKRLTARRLYKSFGVKGLITVLHLSALCHDLYDL